MNKTLILSLSLLVTLCFSQKGVEKNLADARQKFAKKNYEGSLELLNKILATDKNNVDAYVLRGQVKTELKDNGGAMADYNKVIKLDSNNYTALANRGHINSKLKKYDLALKDLNKAQAKQPDSASAYEYRAEIYFLSKKTELAAADYSKAISLKPNDKTLLHKRAECYAILQKPELVLADYQKALELDPKDLEARMYIAYNFLETERYAESKAMYEQLYKEDKKNTYVLNNYGWVLFKLGEDKKSVDLLAQSVEIWPQNAYTYRYLALIFLHHQDKEQACESIKKGLFYGYTKKYGPELDNLKKEHCGK